jgi:hypothetical protein
VPIATRQYSQAQRACVRGPLGERAAAGETEEACTSMLHTSRAGASIRPAALVSGLEPGQRIGRRRTGDVAAMLVARASPRTIRSGGPSVRTLQAPAAEGRHRPGYGDCADQAECEDGALIRVPFAIHCLPQTPGEATWDAA